MKDFLSLCAGIGFLASGAIAQDATPGSVEELMNDLASTNPLLHAIFTDHMDEAKDINATFQAGDEEAAMKTANAMIREYGDAAFSRASDASAIEVLKKAGMSLMLWPLIIREDASSSSTMISLPKRYLFSA